MEQLNQQDEKTEESQNVPSPCEELDCPEAQRMENPEDAVDGVVQENADQVSDAVDCHFLLHISLLGAHDVGDVLLDLTHEQEDVDEETNSS